MKVQGLTGQSKQSKGSEQKREIERDPNRHDMQTRYIKMDGKKVKPQSGTQMVSRRQTLADKKAWIAIGETDRYRRRQIERHGLTPEKAGVLRPYQQLVCVFER